MLLGRRRRAPGFKQGETVRVKTPEAISRSVGASCKLDGLVFMDQMWGYCGQTFPVQRVVDSFFNEHLKRSIRPRAPLYVLDHLVCDGAAGEFAFKCDHGCFLLWHEDWLEKAA